MNKQFTKLATDDNNAQRSDLQLNTPMLVIGKP